MLLKIHLAAFNAWLDLAKWLNHFLPFHALEYSLGSLAI